MPVLTTKREAGATEPQRALAVAGVGGTVYFAVVFAVGFLLGVARTLWLEPRLGPRWAELVELPVMLTWIYLAARWIGRRFSLSDRASAVAVALGGIALVLLLLAELTVVIGIRGLTVAEYLATRDPASGIAYGLSLLIFAAMPALAGRRAS